MPRANSLLKPQKYPAPAGFHPPKRDDPRQAFLEHMQQVFPAMTLPEACFWKELQDRGFHGNDPRDMSAPLNFVYQLPIGGGRTVRGGFVVDFLLYAPPAARETPVELIEAAFHTAAVFGDPSAQRANDRIKRVAMEKLWGLAVYADSDQVLYATRRTVDLSLAGISTARVP